MAAPVAAAAPEAEEDSVAAVKNAKKGSSQGKGKLRQLHQSGSSPVEQKGLPSAGCTFASATKRGRVSSRAPGRQRKTCVRGDSGRCAPRRTAYRSSRPPIFHR
jgi:hypothetical protein